MTDQNQPNEEYEIGDRDRIGNVVITWNTKGEIIDLREYAPLRLVKPKQGKILYPNFQRDK